MQRQTFEANRDMAFIVVTHDAGIFLSDRKSTEENRIKFDYKTNWYCHLYCYLQTNCNIVRKAHCTIEECVETIKEVYQAIHYCITYLLFVARHYGAWIMIDFLGWIKYSV